MKIKTMEDFLEESADFVGGASLSIVMMSHLSDAEISCGEKEKEHIEFVKFLILKYVQREMIDSKALWSEFKKER